MPELLLEIGLEEIPARMIAAAEAELARRVEAVLTRQRLLAAPGTAVTSYSTPRRLAVRVEGVLAQQLDMQEQLTGPSWKAAFPQGEPGPAAQAFAKKAGVPVTALEKITTPKGEYAAATVQRPGQSAEKVLGEELPAGIGALSWPKTMYWRPISRSDLSVRSAGCFVCWTKTWFRWSSPASAPATSAMAIASSTGTSQFPSPGPLAYLAALEAAFVDGRCCRAPPSHPQGARRRNPQSSLRLDGAKTRPWWSR